jgi:hypothetical protein
VEFLISHRYFAKHGYTKKDGGKLTLVGMFGSNASKITIRQLATMRVGGIPVFYEHCLQDDDVITRAPLASDRDAATP